MVIDEEIAEQVTALLEAGLEVRERGGRRTVMDGARGQFLVQEADGGCCYFAGAEQATHVFLEGARREPDGACVLGRWRGLEEGRRG